MHVHNVIRLEPGAEMTLLETGGIGARSNNDRDPGGPRRPLPPSRQQAGRRCPEAGHPSHLFARVGERGCSESFSLAVNGRVMPMGRDRDRRRRRRRHIAAAVLGDGDEGRSTTTTPSSSPMPPNAAKAGVYKGAEERRQGIFRGKILVKPGAQKPTAIRSARASLAGRGSQFLAKPELEIYADDVKCSHGSTTGALDETALFYLRSRGVPKEQAIVLLVLSFPGRRAGRDRG